MSSPGRMSELSFKSMPPLFIPLRFFLTAPWFGIFASLLFLVNYQSILTSRWTVEILAFTHLLTIGFILMSMIGALYQFIPVISGFSIVKSKIIAPIIHIFLILGNVFLVIGFLFFQVLFFQLAFITLLLALGIFVISLSHSLKSLVNKTIIIFVLKLADFALFITIALGLLMLFAYAFTSMDIPFRLYTNMHMFWGGLAWIILLIMAVSSQIIPMFYVTPIFSVKYLKILSISFVISMLLLSIIEFIAIFTGGGYYSQNGFVHVVVEVTLSLCILFFSLYTLWIINQRKRKVKDVTINFWRLSLAMPVIAISLYWINLIAPFIQNTKFELLMGILFVFGFAISSIIGMMQKIVPFIIFMHLQTLIMSHPEKMHLLPNMQTLLSVKNQKIQFYLHSLSLLFLIVSLFINGWALVAAIIMLANFSWLSLQLHKSVKQYLQINKAVLET
jgi:hypothetical protein